MPTYSADKIVTSAAVLYDGIRDSYCEILNAKQGTLNGGATTQGANSLSTINSDLIELDGKVYPIKSTSTVTTIFYKGREYTWIAGVYAS